MMRILALLFLLACGQAWGATYYATPGGGAAASCVDATTNVCTLARAASVASNNDEIILAAGTYVGTEIGASGYMLMSGKAMSLTCAGAAESCILQPSTSTGAVRTTSVQNDTSITWDGIYVDGVNGTAPNYCFWLGDSAGGSYTVTIKNSRCANPVFYNIYVAATGLVLTSTDNDFTATSAVTARSFIYTDRTIQWASGSITITRGTGDIAKQAASTHGMINIEAFAAGLTASVDGFVGSMTLDPTLTSTGEHPCVQLLNVASSTITNSTCNVLGNPGSRSTALFRINSCGNVAGQGCVGTETPRAITTALIRNVTGTIGPVGGYGAIIGQDATSSADNQIVGARIENVNITCTSASNTAHGVMLGYLAGGNASRSLVNGCGINFIAKKVSTSPAVFSGDISINAVSQHFRGKGTLLTWANNNAISLSSSGNLYYADQETVSGTNSTVSAYNNIGYVSGGTPTYNVFVATNSTLSVANTNNFFGLANWHNAGSTYSTLATWNADAAVGTDLAADPQFIGGSSPTTAAGYCLDPTSELLGAGTYIGAWVLGFGGESLTNPPPIGARGLCRARQPVTSRRAVTRN